MKVTISDIAKKANVSKMTVSRVLNGKGHVAKKTAERVKQIIHEFGYQPNLIARSLSSRRSDTIGVIIPKVKQIFLDNYISQICSGITDVAQDHDHHIMLFPIEPKENVNYEYVNIARTNIVGGMILLKTTTNDLNLPLLADIDIPFILVNHKKYSKKYNFVDTDNINGARLAINFLYKLGHREIAFIAGSMNETNAKDRFKGYKDRLDKLGLAYREEWILYGDFNQEKAYQETEKLLRSKNRPTAIFCSDDYMAIGAMDLLKQEGLSIPDDMAIIGFDDVELAAYVKPALTTIRQPLYKLGETATTILLKLIDGKQKKPVHKLLKVELIKRESC